MKLIFKTIVQGKNLELDFGEQSSFAALEKNGYVWLKFWVEDELNTRGATGEFVEGLFRITEVLPCYTLNSNDLGLWNRVEAKLEVYVEN